MLQPVEVYHEGRWIPATLMDTRHDEGGGHGLVGFTDPATRAGYYRWVHERFLRAAPDGPAGAGDARGPAAAKPTTDGSASRR